MIKALVIIYFLAACAFCWWLPQYIGVELTLILLFAFIYLVLRILFSREEVQS